MSTDHTLILTRHNSDMTNRYPPASPKRTPRHSMAPVTMPSALTFELLGKCSV